MDAELLGLVAKQALATAMNCHETGRSNKAIELVSQVNKVDPGNEMANVIMHYIAFGGPRLKILKEFMGDWWGGGSLEGKSIEIFCDQGMGDFINLMRYIKLMKDKWNCKIVVNYHAFYEKISRLIQRVPCIDSFVKFHESCDYYTNLLSIPALLNGLKYDIYYPVHFQDLLNTSIPPQPFLGMFESRLRPEGFKVGLAWHSNMDNDIGKKKSILLHKFALLEDGINEMVSLLPTSDEANFLVKLPIDDLEDTAGIIAGCNVVVSVDTVVLHLAGVMGKRTIGLLPYQADARWGLGDKSVWYPSVELIRQPDNLDWELSIIQVKNRLVSLRTVV